MKPRGGWPWCARTSRDPVRWLSAGRLGYALAAGGVRVGSLVSRNELMVVGVLRVAVVAVVVVVVKVVVEMVVLRVVGRVRFRSRIRCCVPKYLDS